LSPLLYTTRGKGHPSHRWYASRQPGGLAHNPFHPDTTEPYTGYVEVGDYLEDIQLAQMRWVNHAHAGIYCRFNHWRDRRSILAQDYKTEIMWCDIGLANRSATFAAEWFAQTSKEGRQVTIDNRE
jgi:alpha-L-fucosidase